MKYSPRHRTLRYHLWTIFSYVLTLFSAGCVWIWFFWFNRTTVIGREHARRVPRNTLLMSNHQSMVDSFLIGVAAWWPQSVIWPSLLPWNPAAEENFFQPRWLGFLARQWKCIPVREGRRDLRALKIMVEVLPHGTMVLFPEGTRTRDGSVGPARPGAGVLILSTRPTVIPVAIEGMQDALPIGSYVPRVGKRIWVAFGEPVDYSRFLGETRDKETAQAITELVMDRVRALHDDLVRRRREAEGG